MKKYDYILLDWDGNLARTLDTWLAACRESLMRHGIKPTDKEIAAAFGWLIPYLKELGVEDPEAVLEEADKIAKKHLPNVELYPDALEVLENLHELGKKMALVTSSTHSNVDFLIKKYNISRFFEVIIAADDIKEHKPHPEALEKALQFLNGTKDSAIMIGDSISDLGAAQNFGIDSILFYPKEHHKFYDLNTLKAFNPTHIVSNFRDIIKLV